MAANKHINSNLILTGSRTLEIPTHSGIEIDLTGSNAGNIRANSTFYLLATLFCFK